MYKFKNILNNFLKVIYPNKCIFCQEIIPVLEDDFICSKCHIDIDYIISDKPPFLSVFKYNEKTRFSIHRLKYYDKPHYAKHFAKMMYLKFNKFKNLDYDLVVYVPMHFKKKKKRGYDQAEVLAREFSKLANLQFVQGNLIRIKNTLAQSRVTFEQRKSNVEGVFFVKDFNLFKDKKIILIDDIYTSGSTILQCEKELKRAGASKVCFFTLAKV